VKNYKDPNFFTNKEVFDGNWRKHFEWAKSLRTMGLKSYWNVPNTVEFLAFTTKAAIIIPGLLFGISIWWLYILALVTSLLLIWSATIKTMPTLIWFNILWSILAIVFLLKHFMGF
jgi:hypothetical protein